MKLLNIKAHNFLSYEDLELDLDNQGLVLLDGKTNDALDGTFESNSSGKSSLLGAIFYAIYGETPDGRSANNVINRDKGKDTKVVLELEVNGHSYRIERGRKKNFTKLFEDNKELEYSTMKETQQSIESLIGIPEEVFRTTLFFDGHYTTPFSEMTDKQKKEFLSAVVDLDVYSRAHDKTKEDIKGINTEIDNLDYKISVNQQNNARTNDLLKENKDSLSANEATINELNKQLSDLEKEMSTQEYEKYLVQIKETQEEVDNFHVGPSSSVEQDKYQRLYQQVQEASQAKQQANNNVNKVLMELESIKSQLAQGKDTYANYTDLASKAYDKHNIYEAWQYGSSSKPAEELGNIKPNAFDNTKIENVKQQLVKLLSRYKELDAQQEPLHQLALKVEGEYEQLKQALDSQKRAADAEIQDNNSKMSQYQLLTNQLQELLATKHTQDETIKNIKNKLAAANDTRNYILHQLKSLTPASTEEIDKLDKDKQALVAKRIKLEHALEAFSDKGIKSHVLDLVTPALNEGVNKYLSILAGGSIEAEFSTQTKKADGTLSDKLDIVITHDGEEATYGSLSSGEKRRVDIAISLSLQDMVISRFGNDINLLAYDELFESLDAVGSENVVELLRQKLVDVSTIIVISHNEDLKPLFDKTILVTKEQGISTLKVIN